MKLSNFLGGSYPSQAVTADQEQTINWYPEKRKDGQGVILLPVPGLEPVAAVFDGVGRGHLSMDGREWGVFGDRMYELYEDGSKINAGIVHSDEKATTPITISSNGDLGAQLLIVSDEGAYYANITGAGGTYAAVAIAALTGKATMGDYLDGYGLCLDSKTSTMYISALGDFSSWTTGVDFAQRSLAADPWLAMKVAGRYIWLFGEYTTEIWQDVGSRFPFAPLSNQVIEYGIAAQYSAAVAGQDVCWLAQNKSGRTCVMRAGGVNPQVVSTPALEYAISQYTDIPGAVGDVYSWNGHVFYLLHFDTDNVTWCYDITTGEWHQRGTWDSSLGAFKSWSPRWFALAFGEVRALDRMLSIAPDAVDSATSPGFVYRLSDSFPVDVNGVEIRRVRRAPVIVNEDKRLFFSGFQALMDVGEAQEQETVGTVALTGQTAAVALTTIFTVGSEATSYVVELELFISAPTADYSADLSVSYTAGGVATQLYALGADGSSGLVEPETRRVASYSIRADAGTTVSYQTSYGSGAPGMEYDINISIYRPGVTNPQAMLRISDDGGKNWGSEHWASAGKTGEYGTRVHWHRLGAGRRRVFELTVSDPISWKLTDAFVDATAGNE